MKKIEFEFSEIINLISKCEKVLGPKDSTYLEVVWALAEVKKALKIKLREVKILTGSEENF